MAEDQESRDWMLTIRAEGHTSDDVKDLFEQIGSGAVFQKERGGKTDYEHYPERGPSLIVSSTARKMKAGSAILSMSARLS